MTWYRHKCCMCGRFCKWDADSSTPFGSSQDLEPSEPEYYCVVCIEGEKKYHIEAKWLPSNWIPAKWEYEVAKEIGMGRAGYKGGGSSKWFKLDSELPEGYIWRDQPSE